MRIPAPAFSTLPEGCPVLWGDTPATVLGRHGATEYRIQIPGRFPSTTAAHPCQLCVALDSPAAVRAFAPALVQDLTRAEHPPAAVWSRETRSYVLLDFVAESGFMTCQPVDRLVTGDTPEACLLNGLQAALDAAKDAQ